MLSILLKTRHAGEIATVRRQWFTNGTLAANSTSRKAAKSFEQGSADGPDPGVILGPPSAFQKDRHQLRLYAKTSNCNHRSDLVAAVTTEGGQRTFS
jgi:hypothetical protein